ncbi:MAG: xanthine dehydrogenase family protein molybdopterin-binding subunit [Candidatus Tectomicrobia bacterium]|nr:xanthine dehydrogenase family protein molybdopterin-binding subunit [Candidatus Tectomicrobia bacterium]
MGEFAVLGKNLPRIDGRPKATGESQYAADRSVPGCLAGRILRSPYPHARILRIDTSRAEKVRGVKAVLAGKDFPPVRFGQWILDETLFARDKVRYIGDEVAAVAATDDDAAQEALERIQVDYRELPAVFSPEEALRPGAPLVHEDFAKSKALFRVVGREGNQACKVRFHYGDVNVGLSQADEVIENRFRTHPQHPMYLETHAALVECDSTGNLTVWVTTQSVFKSQELIAKLLDMPLSRVRVVGSTVGGGFGGKKPRVEHYAAALAYKTRKPVRIVLSREEDLAATFQRHPAVVDIRSGVKKDGTLTAWDFQMVMDTGAYADHGPSILAMAAFHARGPYRTPHVHIEGRLVYTNKPISGAFRGYGNPQATWAVESQMDIIARELGIDPLELRRKNAMGDGDPMVNGQRHPEVRLRETLDQAAEVFGWGKRPGTPSGGKKRGIGIACGSHPSGGMGSSALVKVMADGTVQVLSGVIEIGPGEYTVAAQVAAETLGVPYEKVRMVAADTDGTPFENITAASRVTFSLGHSVRLAAEDARREILRRAAKMLEARPEDLRAESERVFLASAPDRGLSYAEVAKAANLHLDGPILGKGSFSANSPPVVPENIEGSAFRDFPAQGFVTHIAEVEVDGETGEVEVLRMVCSHDIGRAINPTGVEGQIEGGVTQGIGYALIEEMIFEGGALVNGSLASYEIPGTLDVPPIEPHFVEKPDPAGPYGAKGVGEAVLVPTAPAIANAVYDAIGARVKDLPITPHKVLQALRKKA